MSDQSNKRLKNLAVRAKLPQYFRIAAVAVLGITVLAIGLGFYSARNRTAFHLKSEHARLSDKVVAEVNSYERLETDGDLKKYYVKADRAVTFSDNHQELENVFIQVFDDQGVNSDKITAAKALYVPEEGKNFTAYLAGDVNIETRDDLKIRTEQITYTKSQQTAESEEPVEFTRGNVKGKATGAVVNIGSKRLELLHDVDIQTFESPDAVASNVQQAHITAGSATYDQAGQVIQMRDNMKANIVSAGKNIDAASDHANVIFVGSNGSQPVLSKVELITAVNINSADQNGKVTRIASGYALYDKPADRFELKNGVHIITADGDSPTDLRSNEAAFDQTSLKVELRGNVEITQKDDFLKGQSVDADLYQNRKLKVAVVRGDAYLKQAAPERTTEVSADQLNAAFSEDQVLTAASSSGASSAILTPVQNADYSKITLNAPVAIHLWFQGQGLIDRAQTDGRTTIQLSVLDGSADAANKKLVADTVRTFFHADGKNMEKAEAIGNAELYVEPLRASPENYKTLVAAPRFDCEFFATGNNARTCVAGVKTKTTREPTQPASDRGTQTMTSDRVTAVFGEKTKDIERLDATGKAKFSELDRSGVANQFSFTSADGMVRLRGSEPSAWDSKARVKANEIDWDTRNQRSYFRGRVSTTYYNQLKTGGATPFSDPDKPVYLTADIGEIDHRSQVAKYNGSARGWQDNNYVRADSFLIDQNKGTFFADGKVQSVLYNAARRENGKDVNVPAFASSQKLTYGRDSRILHYEGGVDIRQGTDRMTSRAVDIYLNEKNEMAQSIAQNDVVITQPNRKATGEYAQYIAADDTIVLRGNPATVTDAENGSSQGGEVKVYLRDNRVLGEGKSKQNTTGRVRSVYKVKGN